MQIARVFALTNDATTPHTLRLSQAPTTSNYVPAGNTQRFYTFFLRKLGAQGAAICQTLLGKCEADFAALTGTFGVTPPASSLPFHVYVTDDIDGAMHYGCNDTEIYVGANLNWPPTSDTYGLLLAAEVVEVFEAAINVGWDCAFSNGEALSRVLAVALHPGSQVPELVTAPVWLDKSPPVGGNRYNWVDTTYPSDSDPFSVGCSVLFLNWMNKKVGVPWDRIARAGGKTLEDTYQNVIGARDGWAKFKQEIDARFPPGPPSGVTTDNPF